MKFQSVNNIFPS